MVMQTISISAQGEISTLRRKPGAGVNLASLAPGAKVRVSRVSEILWDEEAQFWYVHMIHARLPGDLTNKMLVDAGLTDVAQSAKTKVNGVSMFATYEDAVAAEVAFIEWWQAKHGALPAE